MSKQTLKDEAAREQIRTRLGVNLLVEAGAGSGKTESLAGRMVALIATGSGTVEQIAAVTFTKKAAAELRGRFRMELERRIGVDRDPAIVERLHEAMSSMERMFAGTIHSFCAKLLRERPVEAGLAPGFREIEEAEDAVLRRAAWREFIDGAQKEQSPELAALLDAELRLADLHDGFAWVCQYPDVEFPPGDGTLPDAAAAWREMDRFWQRLRSMCPPINAKSTCKIQLATIEFESRYRNASRKRIAVLASMLGMWEAERKVVQKWWPGNGKEAEALVNEFRAVTIVPFLLAWRHYLYRLAMTLLTGGATLPQPNDSAVHCSTSPTCCCSPAAWCATIWWSEQHSKASIAFCSWTSFRTPIRCNSNCCSCWPRTLERGLTGPWHNCAPVRYSWWVTPSNRFSVFAVPISNSTSRQNAALSRLADR